MPVVVVVQNATFLDLNKAIQRYVQLRQEHEGSIQHICWTYVWKTYHLTSSGEMLRGQEETLRFRYPQLRGGILHQKAKAKVNSSKGSAMRAKL